MLLLWAMGPVPSAAADSAVFMGELRRAIRDTDTATVHTKKTSFIIATVADAMLQGIVPSCGEESCWLLSSKPIISAANSVGSVSSLIYLSNALGLSSNHEIILSKRCASRRLLWMGVLGPTRQRPVRRWAWASVDVRRRVRSAVRRRCRSIPGSLAGETGLASSGRRRPSAGPPRPCAMATCRHAQASEMCILITSPPEVTVK